MAEQSAIPWPVGKTKRSINGRAFLWRGHRCERDEIGSYRTLCGLEPGATVYLACGQSEFTCMGCALILDQEYIDANSDPSPSLPVPESPEA